MNEQASSHGENFERSNEPKFMIFHNTEAFVRHQTPLGRWPLHITITPPFELENGANDIGRLRSLVREIASDYQPFRVEIDEEKTYWPEHSTPVTTLASETLHRLHERFLWDLGSIGCRHIDMTYIGTRYSPHITWQRGVIAPFSDFKCDSISIAKKENGIKEMIDTQLLLER